MILSSRLLKNRPVYAGLALENRFSFATVLAANLGCNRFRIMSEIVSKLLRPTI